MGSAEASLLTKSSLISLLLQTNLVCYSCSNLILVVITEACLIKEEETSAAVLKVKA